MNAHERELLRELAQHAQQCVLALWYVPNRNVPVMPSARPSRSS